MMHSEACKVNKYYMSQMHNSLFVYAGNRQIILSENAVMH